ncbi:hypothetical protein Gohar_007876 [Gossypium harknessii]|uniref:Uncharacterized protein n=1 Tax=Gossypium harknessii TaxID=34285 RepID=A0A7J9GK11_9ROSI|nr:hypothetical protein [Gossypium harknessii]
MERPIGRSSCCWPRNLPFSTLFLADRFCGKVYCKSLRKARLARPPAAAS